MIDIVRLIVITSLRPRHADDDPPSLPQLQLQFRSHSRPLAKI
jgi:hypothetical protein